MSRLCVVRASARPMSRSCEDAEEEEEEYGRLPQRFAVIAFHWNDRFHSAMGWEGGMISRTSDTCFLLRRSRLFREINRSCCKFSWSCHQRREN